MLDGKVVVCLSLGHIDRSCVSARRKRLHGLQKLARLRFVGRLSGRNTIRLAGHLNHHGQKRRENRRGEESCE